ncbi:universal stress protein [Paracoccus aerodenitrificans]|uniref:universal stress protein n=1 Tax=Paracoccus aerodenitrificans TaxID=3017781 RepID=UPI0022F1041E|nr:universal stress protein [Paracoccus aerodenitrificans]WBU63930.1 universal stress protein [Paracoccus aerodenitrificans]
MDRILALLDGSAYSESVCHHAAWIAGRLGAAVDALHVLGRREGAASADLSGTLRLGARSALLEELSALDAQRAKIAQARGYAILDDAKAILEAAGVTQVTTRLRRGDLLDALREAEAGSRAVVIGKRGEGADFATGHLGSNLERVVRSSAMPIFVASREFRPISRVLLAYDASASAKAAIERVAQSPVFHGLDLQLIFIGEDRPDMQAQLTEAAGFLRQNGLQASVRIESGEPEHRLAQLVSTEGYDLLVMGAHGHSRIRNLIIGLTTTAMIQAVRIPVLLYR